MSDWTQFPDDLADRCVKCAQCLSSCPTWRLDGDEAESPRGRIALMLSASAGLVPTDGSVLQHLDQCTQCGHCEPVCPADVPYRALIVAARAATGAARRAPWHARLLRWLVARPALFNHLVVPALRAWSHVPGLRHPLLPRDAPQAPRSGRYAPTGAPSGETVSLFLGCVARAVDGATLNAALAALRAAGHTVDVPSAQACCGALHAHAGDAAMARALAMRNERAFVGAARIASCASGCAPDLRASLGDRVVDVSRLLPPGPAAAADTVLHVPCTQATAGDAAAAAALVPGARVLPSLGRCCGAAGEYVLQQPALAARLRDRVLDEAGDAAVLCTSNPGCALHLRAGLAARGAATRVVHPVLECSRATRPPH